MPCYKNKTSLNTGMWYNGPRGSQQARQEGVSKRTEREASRVSTRSFHKLSVQESYLARLTFRFLPLTVKQRSCKDHRQHFPVKTGIGTTVLPGTRVQGSSFVIKAFLFFSFSDAKSNLSFESLDFLRWRWGNVFPTGVVSTRRSSFRAARMASNRAFPISVLSFSSSGYGRLVCCAHLENENKVHFLFVPTDIWMQVCFGVMTSVTTKAFSKVLNALFSFLFLFSFFFTFFSFLSFPQTCVIDEIVCRALRRQSKPIRRWHRRLWLFKNLLTALTNLTFIDIDQHCSLLFTGHKCIPPNHVLTWRFGNSQHWFATSLVKTRC